MKSLKIAAPAEAEFRKATAWYRDRNPRVAEKFTAEAAQTLKLIHAFPQIGDRVPGVDDDHVRRMPVHTFPYYVVFVELRDHLEVIAFAHNRRRPAYFIRRLKRI